MPIWKTVCLLALAGACGEEEPNLAIGKLDTVLNSDSVHPLDTGFLADAVPLSVKRNVLVLIADDLGVDMVKELELFDQNVQTPTLTRLAAAGVVFDKNWSHPVCSATRAGIYSGQYAFRTGIGNVLTTQLGTIDDGLLPCSPGADPATCFALLPKALPNAVAGLFGKWHVGITYRPMDHGWQHFAGVLAGDIDDYWKWEKTIDDAEPVANAYYATKENVEDALGWIAEKGAEQWLSVVAFNAPHSPYHWPPETCTYVDRTGESGEPGLRQYKSMVECLDWHIGDLLDRIDATVLERTTVIFIGDNGTPKDKSEADPCHAKASLYQGGVHVPLIVADGHALVHGTVTSNDLDQGRVSGTLHRHEDALVHTTDLFATIADIMDGDASRGIDSKSIAPYLRSDSAANQREQVFTEIFSSLKYCYAARGRRYKVMYERVSGGPGCYALFDLQRDPDEADNLFKEEADAQAQVLIDYARSIVGAERPIEDFASAASCGDNPVCMHDDSSCQ